MVPVWFVTKVHCCSRAASSHAVVACVSPWHPPLQTPPCQCMDGSQTQVCTTMVPSVGSHREVGPTCSTTHQKGLNTQCSCHHVTSLSPHVALFHRRLCWHRERPPTHAQLKNPACLEPTLLHSEPLPNKPIGTDAWPQWSPWSERRDGSRNQR